MGQQVWSRHAARDRAAGSGLLHHLFAAATGFLDPGDLDYLHLRGDHVEQFADILTDNPQIATAIRAASAGIQFAALPQRGIRDAWTATEFWLRCLIDSGFISPSVRTVVACTTFESIP